MSTRCIVFIWATKSNMCLNNNERWALGFSLSGENRMVKNFEIIHIINMLYVPVIALKTTTNVFAKRQTRITLNGDMVVIVEID